MNEENDRGEGGGGEEETSVCAYGKSNEKGKKNWDLLDNAVA